MPRTEGSTLTENQIATSPAVTSANAGMSARRLILPLALAQFICSFAGSNMNVMITDISDDLDTTVKGVQTAITLFLLIMAILMIPCSKLTDRWGRKRCFTWGLTLYGMGALLSAVSPGLGVLIVGNSVFEGVGTALLIPPVYILATLWFTDTTSRAWAFGAISGLGGVGAAAGPLIGGLITTGISWRAAFVFQALVVATIVLLSRRLDDPLPPDPTRPFDAVGAILSAVGMFFLVFGILQAGTNNVLFAALFVLGVAFLIGFFFYIRAQERAGKEPLLSTGLFRNRISNLALVTQNTQWLLLMGVSFVVSVFLQEVRGYSAIGTGVVFTAATVGRLGLVLRSVASREEVPAAETDRGRLPHHPGRDRSLARVRPCLVEGRRFRPRPAAHRPRPGCDADPFGQRRAVQFPGGAARRDLGPLTQRLKPRLDLRYRHAGTILVSVVALGTRSYAVAMIVLALFGLVGLVAALRLPAKPAPKTR